MSNTEYEKKCEIPSDHPLLSDEAKQKIEEQHAKIKKVMRQFRTLERQELSDAYAAQSEMLNGIREIYRCHGQDSHIADICNRLIDRYGREAT